MTVTNTINRMPDLKNRIYEFPGILKPELEELMQRLNQPRYRSQQIYSWIYRRRINRPDAMSNLPLDLRSRLDAIVTLPLLRVTDDRQGPDGSRKLLFSLADGERVEAVLIPEGERLTGCLSSQVGCLVGCQFCATGLIGFKRNLSGGEIVAQLIQLESAAGRPLTNVVMMGMGEPMLNRPGLFRALRLFTDSEGIGLSGRRITVSTAGWVPGIEALIKSDFKVKLAVSLNATTEEQRRKLMPLAAKYPIAAIIDVMSRYGEKTGLRPAISYLLLNGFNDTAADAKRLAVYARRAGAKVNLMEYNHVSGEFTRTALPEAERFLKALTEQGVTVTLRTSRGRDIAAACGQLAGQYARKQMLTVFASQALA